MLAWLLLREVWQNDYSFTMRNLAPTLTGEKRVFDLIFTVCRFLFVLPHHQGIQRKLVFEAAGSAIVNVVHKQSSRKKAGDL
jgi:hypothetical protein